MLLVLDRRAHVNAEDSHHHVMCYVEGLHEIPAWRVHVVKWNLNSFIHGNSRKHSRVQIIFRLFFFEDFSMFLGFLLLCVCVSEYTMVEKWRENSWPWQKWSSFARGWEEWWGQAFSSLLWLWVCPKSVFHCVRVWVGEWVGGCDCCCCFELDGGKKHFWMFEVEMKGRMRSDEMFSFSAHNNELNR